MAGNGRIVVGVDGSEPSIEALRWAVREALLTGRRVDVVTAWQPVHSYAAVPPLGAPVIPGSVATVDGDYAAAASAEARAVAEEAVRAVGLAQVGVDHCLLQVEGPAAPVLAEASRAADMVVVGPNGHNALLGMLLGSVSNHLILHAACPVVVVRTSPS
jgi:nucleotide-binding universal stress UspA family protein